MEATAYSLYFSAFLVVLAVRRNQVSLVPRYCLYGEPPQTADDWFLHFEDLDDRTRPAAWRVRPHAHVDLHQVFRFRHGRGWVTAEEETIALFPAIDGLDALRLSKIGLPLKTGPVRGEPHWGSRNPWDLGQAAKACAPR
jgi:hypothetical protein